MKPGSPYCKTVVFIITLMAFISMNGYAQDENPNDKVVAVINAIPLTEGDVQLEIKRIQFQAKTMRQPIDDSMMEAMREKVIQSIINRELLYQESKARGISVDTIEIDVRLDQIKQQLNTGQELEIQLAQMGISMDAFREQVRQATAIQKLLETDIYARTEVSDKEARIFFENNPQFFKKPEEVKASHILIQVKADDDEEKKLAAKQKIETIQEKLTAGEDFAELAKTFSEGPSGANGGDLGYFDRKKMVKPFSDAAFALEPGQISDIVQTRFGYHLIRVIDKKPKSSYAFDNIKPQLVQMLHRRKIQTETKQYLDELQKKAAITRNAP
jgi:peptidyl-prolyl cis-trans isomerase C